MRLRHPEVPAASSLLALLLLPLLFAMPHVAKAQDSEDQAVIRQLLKNEEAASRQKSSTLYTSDERSDRTGGHLWEERVADLNEGKMRLLVAEDGHALSPERRETEIKRLREIARNPQEFLSTEQAKSDDEQHARRMLDLLPRAFLFERVPSGPDNIKMLFKPYPAFTPSTFEERVLHGMSGTLVIDARSFRLRQLNGRLGADVSLGFGVLAVVRSGSTFATERTPIAGGLWKTTLIQTDVSGRAILFKTIARKQSTVHRDFSLLPQGTSIPAAVDLLLRGITP